MFTFSQLFNLRLSNYPTYSLVEPFLGAEATITDSIPPQGKGKVRIFGCYWSAKVDIPTKWEIPAGTRVMVQYREGLTLTVKVLSMPTSQLVDLSSWQSADEAKTAA